MTMHKLQNILDSADETSRTAVFEDGSSLLVLPGSGRVLGLYAPDSSGNFFWTNPALESRRTASSFFKSEKWRNPGGDRTWLAPEIEIFIGDLSNPMGTYKVPVELDPGKWRIAAKKPCLLIENKTNIFLRNLRKNIRLEIVKEWKPAPNPLRNSGLKEIAYAGYEQETKLELATGNKTLATQHIGIWNLIQLPNPGRMIIPTYSKTEPRIIFGKIPRSKLNADRNLVNWTMDGEDGSAKISIKAGELTGRAGYLYRSCKNSATWNLVIRNFAVNPSGEYIDTPWNDLSDRGYAFQACSVTDGTVKFNELEYHVPAAAAVQGRNISCDRSQVWAFRGDSAKIAKVAELLLGICI